MALGLACSVDLLGTTLAGTSPSLRSHRANFTVASWKAVRRGFPVARTHEPGVSGEQALGRLAVQPHLSRRQGNPASSFLMSSISMENMNLFGWDPNTGDSIVLASAPASGDPAPAWLFSRCPEVLGQLCRGLNPATFLAWEMDPGE